MNHQLEHTCFLDPVTIPGHDIPRNHGGLGGGISPRLTDNQSYSHPPSLRSVILWIGYGNSTVNPFIYGFFCREFRAVITSDLRKVRVKMESRNENATVGV